MSMEFWKPPDLTMAHNLPTIYLLSLLRSETSITPPAPLGTQRVMAKPKPVKRVSLPMLNIQSRTAILPCWHTGAHPFMSTFLHQLKCSTREQ